MESVYRSRLKGHADTVNSLSIHNNILASGSDDTTIRLWDLRTHTGIRMGRLGQPVQNVRLCGEKILCTAEATLAVFDLRVPDIILEEF